MFRRKSQPTYGKFVDKALSIPAVSESFNYISTVYKSTKVNILCKSTKVNKGCKSTKVNITSV